MISAPSVIVLIKIRIVSLIEANVTTILATVRLKDAVFNM